MGDKKHAAICYYNSASHQRLSVLSGFDEKVWMGFQVLMASFLMRSADFFLRGKKLFSIWFFIGTCTTFSKKAGQILNSL
jgi:hypothetical protein